MSKLKESERKGFAPKVIHFIWAGGIEIMPKEVCAPNVKAWLKKNPDFKVWLWVDIATARGRTDSRKQKWLLDKYRDLFNDFLVTFDEKAISKNNTKLVIILKDIETEKIDGEKIADPYIRHSIDRFDPNFGISSDLLRYKILYRYGGAYFDSDVKPGKEKLNTLDIYRDPKQKHRLHYLYVDHLSQKFKVEKEDLSNFDIEYNVGNDAFVCSRHNPIMNDFYLKAIKKFDARKHDLKLAIGYCYSSINFVHVTIYMTGPEHIVQCLNKHEYEKKYREKEKSDSDSQSSEEDGMFIPELEVEAFSTTFKNEDIEIWPLRSRGRKVCLPEEFNTRLWINVSVYLIRSEQDVRKRLDKIIKFELTHFGVLRLEDHFYLLRRVSSRIDNLKATTILFDILSANTGLLKNVQVVQYLYTPEMTRLIDKLKSSNIFNLNARTQHANEYTEDILFYPGLLRVLYKQFSFHIQSKTLLSKRYDLEYIEKILYVFQKMRDYIKGSFENMEDVDRLKQYLSVLSAIRRLLSQLSQLGLKDRVEEVSKHMDLSALGTSIQERVEGLEKDVILSNSYKEDEHGGKSPDQSGISTFSP